MSVQSELVQFLRRFSPEPGLDYVPLTPEEVAAQTGYSREKVNKTLFNLMVHGKVELIRGPNGRQIIGFRNTDAPVDARRREGAAPPRQSRQRLPSPMLIEPGHAKPRSFSTPRLDEYLEAKRKFQRLTEELGPLVRAEFEENPYAEEANQLRMRLAAVEADFIRLRNEHLQAVGDLRAIKGRRQAEMTRSAMEAGAIVVHSSD